MFISEKHNRAASPGPDSGCFVGWTGQEWHSLVDPREKGLVWEVTESHARRDFCGYARLVLQKNMLSRSSFYHTNNLVTSIALCCFLQGYPEVLMCNNESVYTSLSRHKHSPKYQLIFTAVKLHTWQHLDWPLVTSLIWYLKSGPPQLQDISSRLKLWFERSMITSMALDLSKAIWSSAVSSLQIKILLIKWGTKIILNWT